MELIDFIGGWSRGALDLEVGNRDEFTISAGINGKNS